MTILCDVWFCAFNLSCSPLPVVQLWKPKESLWRSWIWIADPDGGESALPGGHAVGVVVSIGAFGGRAWMGGQISGPRGAEKVYHLSGYQTELGTQTGFGFLALLRVHKSHQYVLRKVCTRVFEMLVSIAFPKSNAAVSIAVLCYSCLYLFGAMLNLQQIVPFSSNQAQNSSTRNE